MPYNSRVASNTLFFRVCGISETVTVDHVLKLVNFHEFLQRQIIVTDLTQADYAKIC